MIEIDPEPPNTVVENSSSELELLLSAVCDYTKVTCDTKPIHFKDTMLYQTRVYKWVCFSQYSMYVCIYIHKHTGIMLLFSVLGSCKFMSQQCETAVPKRFFLTPPSTSSQSSWCTPKARHVKKATHSIYRHSFTKRLDDRKLCVRSLSHRAWCLSIWAWAKLRHIYDQMHANSGLGACMDSGLEKKFECTFMSQTLGVRALKLRIYLGVTFKLHSFPSPHIPALVPYKAM